MSEANGVSFASEKIFLILRDGRLALRVFLMAFSVIWLSSAKIWAESPGTKMAIKRKMLWNEFARADFFIEGFTFFKKKDYTQINNSLYCLLFLPQT